MNVLVNILMNVLVKYISECIHRVNTIRNAQSYHIASIMVIRISQPVLTGHS